MERYNFSEALERMKRGHAVTNTFHSFKDENNESHFVVLDGSLTFKNGNKIVAKNLQTIELESECWHDFDLRNINVDKRIRNYYCYATEETEAALIEAGYPNFLQAGDMGEKYFIVEDVDHVWKSRNIPYSFEPMRLSEDGTWIFGSLE